MPRIVCSLSLFVAAIILNAPYVCVASNDDDVAASECLNIGYYANMSGQAFVYGGELYSHIRRSDKLGVARDIAYMMFVYWIHTRREDAPRSEMVDKMIHLTYRTYFMDDRLCQRERVFEDPLIRIGERDRPSRQLPLNLQNSINIEDDYDELRDLFIMFLRGTEEGESGPALKNQD